MLETEQNLYIVTMKVMAIGGENEEVQTLGQEIVTKISSFTYANVQNMHDRYTLHLLKQIEGLEITEAEEVLQPIVLLSGIIRITGLNISNIKTFQSFITLALKNTCAEGRVLILKSIAEVMLLWNENVSENENEDELTYLKTFIEEIIAPYLIWHAGRCAETVRTMATACLCATIQGTQQDISEKLILNFSLQILPLIEDNSIRTRAYALRILLCSGPLDLETLKPIIFQVSARLDDPCAEVRELAATCLGYLKPDCEEKEVWSVVIDQIIERMILHLESPEVKLKEILTESLLKIAGEFPDVYQKHLNALPNENPIKKLLVKKEETKL